MSIDQNESQANLGPQQGPPPVSTSPNQDGTPAQGGAGQQQRRRRRRRKGAKLASVVNPVNPEAAAPSAADTGQPGEQPAPQFREQRKDQSQPAPYQASGGGQTDSQRPPRNNHQNQKKRHGKGGGANGQSNPGNGAPAQNRYFQKNGHQQQPREYNPGNSIGSPNGGQNGGGARRKNKARREAPTFVGPMDHSYRVVNGNVADGPPSTMDFRGGMANGNSNGNLIVRGGYSDSGEIMAPVVLREDAPVRILCFIEDLFIVAKMQETARKLGVKVGFAKAEKDTVTKLTEAGDGERPSLIVFDLNNTNAKPLTLIPKLKAKLKRGTSIIGFLSHIQGDLKVKATEAGCDMVMPKSAFSQNLPNLLRRHGLDEEVEAIEA